MKITQVNNDNTVTLTLSGRLDSVTSSELADLLNKIYASGPVHFIFDFTALAYISSAGLRVLLSAQKKVNAFGTSMKIVGAKPEVKEVFVITGFADIMTFEA
jgi:anti-sigma B factor antagonist